MIAISLSHIVNATGGCAIALGSPWTGLRDRADYGLMASGAWLLVIGTLLAHERAQTVVTTIEALYVTWLWWNDGPGSRTKKVARELGAESLAQVQRLVDQIVPSPIPSPGGAA